MPKGENGLEILAYFYFSILDKSRCHFGTVGSAVFGGATIDVSKIKIKRPTCIDKL